MENKVKTIELSIGEQFKLIANKYKEKEAICIGDDSLTYDQLRKRVERYSNYLYMQGICYGDRIAVCMDNGLDIITTMLVAAQMGVALVPFNHTLPWSAVEKYLTYTETKHIIAKSYFIEMFEERLRSCIKGSIISADRQINSGLPCLKEACDSINEKVIVPIITGKEDYLIILTSGSTGNPKPIVLSQENKVKRIVAHIKEYDLSGEDRILSATPLYHSLAQRLVLLPLMIGGTAIWLERFTPRRWVETVQNREITFTIAVSAQLTQVLKYLSELDTKINIGTLKKVVSSSALLDTKTRSELLQYLSGEFYEMYGTSETSTVTSILINNDTEGKQSVGKSFANATIKIIDEQNQEVKADTIGEIVCKTDLLCKGYYNQIDQFRDSFVGEYFRTGDFGYLDKEGYVYFSGRKKEIIITGGINVFPSDIEECVLAMNAIKECAAFSLEDEALGECVCLAVVLKENNNLAEKEIKFYCAKNLANYQQPKRIFFLHELPQNDMGKLVRFKIQEIIKEKKI